MWRDERQIQEGAHPVIVGGNVQKCSGSAAVFHVGGVYRGVSATSGGGRWSEDRAGPPRAAKGFEPFDFSCFFTQDPPTFNLSDQVAV